MTLTIFDLTEFLGEVDPLQLTKLGAPLDEYEPEATSIHSLLQNDALTPTSLRNVFIFWFSESICPWKTDDDPQLIQLCNDICALQPAHSQVHVLA